jgi:transposase
MSATKHDDVPTKVSEARPRVRKQIEPGSDFTVKCLLRYINSRIERIERMREAVVEDCQSRDFLPQKVP